MDLATLAPHERQQRMNVRNFFIRASIKELENELRHRSERKDKIGVLALQEMINACKAQGVDNFGLTH